MARLTILCGLPGSGKSTLSRRIAAATGAARMCPDDWMNAMGVTLWDQALRARLEAAQWVESQHLLLTGNDVVIEWGTWARDERDVLRDWCRANGVAVSLVHLDVPIDELERRLMARNAGPDITTPVPPDMVREWAEGPFQAPTADELAAFDPFELPPEVSLLRAWRVDDIPFLWEVLHLSIHLHPDWPVPPFSIVDEPGMAHYLRDFGRIPGDDAVIAVDEAGTRLGAAFCRCTTADAPGYGYVRDGVPELGMAVVEAHRGQGVGRAMLVALLERHPVMSLSVDHLNTNARTLYESLGFVQVGDDDNSATMLREPR